MRQTNQNSDLARRMSGDLSDEEKKLIEASRMRYVSSLGILETHGNVAERCIFDNTPLILAPVSRIHLHKTYLSGGMRDCVLEIRSAYYECPHCSMIFNVKMKTEDVVRLKCEKRKKIRGS